MYYLCFKVSRLAVLALQRVQSDAVFPFYKLKDLFFSSTKRWSCDPLAQGNHPDGPYGYGPGTVPARVRAPPSHMGNLSSLDSMFPLIFFARDRPFTRGGIANRNQLLKIYHTAGPEARLILTAYVIHSGNTVVIRHAQSH